MISPDYMVLLSLLLSLSLVYWYTGYTGYIAGYIAGYIRGWSLIIDASRIKGFLCVVYGRGGAIITFDLL